MKLSISRRIGTKYSYILFRFLIISVLLISVISVHLSGIKIVYGATTVCTTTNNLAIQYSNHDKLINDGSRWWLFFWNHTSGEWKYKYSDDLITWSSSYTTPLTNVATSPYDCAPYGRDGGLDIFLNGTNIYASHVGGAYQVWWFRGVISDSTITWDALRTLKTTGYYQVGGSTIKGGDGKIWVAVHDAHYNIIYTNVSSDEGNTWPTKYNVDTQTIDASSGGISLVVLNGTKVMLIHKRVNALYSYVWSGSSWGSAVSLSATTTSGFPSYSATYYNGKVYLAYVKSNNSLMLMIYNGTTWQTEKKINDVAGNSYPTVTFDRINNRLYVFWQGSPTSNHIYFKIYYNSNSSFGSIIDWINESSDTITSYTQITSTKWNYGYHVSIMYMTKSGSPYNIKVADIDFTPPPPPLVTDDPIINITINRGLFIGGLAMLLIPVPVIAYKGRERTLSAQEICVLVVIMIIGLGLVLTPNS